MTLTKRQKEVFDAIKRLMKRNGCAPSYQEIATECGVRSVSTVHKHVGALRAKRFISHRSSGTRDIEITRVPEKLDQDAELLLDYRNALEALADADTGVSIEGAANDQTVHICVLVGDIRLARRILEVLR